MATLVRYNSFPTFFNPFEGRPVINRYHNQKPNQPAVNVKETDTAFVLDLAAPGLKKEDFKISVANNTLTIGYRPEETKDETTEKFTRHEFGITSFERGFRLPKTVNVEGITAAYTDGILTVELTKIEKQEENLVKEIAVA